MSSTQCLHDGVVEDLLWNSLDGNVSKQRDKDTSLEDLLPQKGQIGGIRIQLSTSTQPLSDKMRKLVSFEVIPHLCYSFSNNRKTNTKKGDRNEGYHL